MKKTIKLKRNEALLILVDIQERMLPAMAEYKNCIKSSITLTKAAKAYDMPVFYTEQYPKGLGPTSAELLKELEGARPFEKFLFSALTEELRDALKETGKKQVILTGMETHVCVYQTAVDLLQEGYSVFLPADGVSSRTEENKANALKLLSDQGALISNTETLLFELIESAKDPHFKELQALIK